MTTTFFTPRLQRAVEMCIAVHGHMKRKGDDQPYLIHPISVLALLSRWGADEDTCIAGLLHDTIEDAPDDAQRTKIREEIDRKFGRTVLQIVEDVTEQDKSLPWKERKERYIAHLEGASQEAQLVSCADKTHNAFSLLAAFKEQGQEVWKHFNADREETLWFYWNVLRILKENLDETYTEELHNTLSQLDVLSFMVKGPPETSALHFGLRRTSNPSARRIFDDRV